MRLDVTDAFSSGGLCYEQGERPTCKVQGLDGEEVDPFQTQFRGAALF
jgi:hypothetical protein